MQHFERNVQRRRMPMHLFFDLGSTLIDESLCDHQSILDSVANSSITAKEYEDKLKEFAKRNENFYACARAHFELPEVTWRHDLERLYSGVREMLKRLSRHHKLGIIANQQPGLRNRLGVLGIEPFFVVIVGSGDAGLRKPDPAIFKAALAQAQCPPEQAVMIGDRLDNDILPAQNLGMKTIWVRQGFGAYGDPDRLPKKPDYTIRNILELEQLALDK